MADSHLPSTQPPAPKQQPSDDPPDALAGLYHMSNTAGVSTQEYVSINTTAIASLFLGFASVLVFFNSLLLVLPVAGIICALVARHQIRNSNQTQTGNGLAMTGLILSLALGLGKGGFDAVSAMRTTADERAIAQLTQDLGQDLVAKDYQKAYQRFDQAFQERVPLAKFLDPFKAYEEVPSIGALQSVQWNGQHMEMEEKTTGVVEAYEMVYFRFTHAPGPRRVVINCEKNGDTWRLHDVPTFFAPPKKGQ